MRRLIAPLMLVVLSTAACGGGGGGGGGFAGTLVQGEATKGPIKFGTVRIFELNADGSAGAQIGGSVSTFTTGAFSFIDLSTRSATGFLMVEVRGGAPGAKYRDEVTGLDVPLGSADVMRAVFRQGTVSDRVALTPLTTMAAARVAALAASGTSLDLAVDSANTGVAQQFGLGSILRVLPVDPTDATAVLTAERARRLYGLVLGGLSQLAKTVGADAFDLGTALAEDLEDGVLDGKDGSGSTVTVPLKAGGSTPLSAAAGTADLQTAINTFTASASNKTNIAAMVISDVAVSIGASSSASLRITTTVPPAFVSGQSGSTLLAAAGGVPPYTWTASGTLPTGLSLSTNGTLSGTANLSGGTTRSVTPIMITVTDSSQPPSTRTVQLSISVVAPGPTITCQSLSDATEGKPYAEVAATATGGVQPLSFFNDSFLNGVDPLGMGIDINGKLTGTPPTGAAGSYTFGVCVVDAVGAQACCGGLHMNVLPVPPPGGGGGGGGGGSVAAFDGIYDATITTVTPAGPPTSGPGTFTTTNGNVSDPGGTFVGTVDANGSFTGTTIVSQGGTPFPMSGTFSTTSQFTISGASGSVSQTILATKR